MTRPVLVEEVHPGLGVLTLTEVDPRADLELLVGWLREERARFWGMTDYTADEIAEVYGWLDEQQTHHAYLARLDGVPAALLQSYLPEADVIGEHYDREPGDIGVHFFVGPGDRRPDFSGRVLVFFARYLLADPDRRRIVVEPDARNQAAIDRMVRMGCVLGPVTFVPGPLPEIPGKTAQFAFLERDRFEELYGLPAT